MPRSGTTWAGSESLLLDHIFGAPAATDGALSWLARAFSRRDVSFLLIAVIAVMDLVVPRPYTHVLWVVVVLAAAAGAAIYWSRHASSATAMAAAGTLAGATLGVSAHFLRDVTTAPTSLWWPASHTAMEVAGWYLGALLVIVHHPTPKSGQLKRQSSMMRASTAPSRSSGLPYRTLRQGS